MDRPALVALARAVECAGAVDSSELKVILGPFTAAYPAIAVDVLLALANGELTIDGPPEDVVPSGEAGTDGEVPDVSDTTAVLGLAPDDPFEATDTGDIPARADPSPSGAGESRDADRSGEPEPAGHAAPDDVVEDEKIGDEEPEPHEGAGTDEDLPFERLGRSEPATDADDGDPCPDLTADAPTPTTGVAVPDDRLEIQQGTEATARPPEFIDGGPLDDGAQGSAPASALADLDALVGSALEKGRYGLAAFLASVTDQPGARHRAIDSLAYASEMRAPSGGCAVAYLEVVDGLTLDQMAGDRPAQLISLAGALRAAITAPTSGAADLLERLRPAFPEIEDTLSAFASSARQGVAISDVRAAASDVADAQHRLAEAVATAEERATTVGARNIKFHAATKVWREWVTSGGVLGSLLATASRGSWPSPEERKRDADDLRARVTDLRSERSFKRHMEDADQRVQNRYEIEAGARETLRNWWNDVLDTVERWIEAVHVLDEADARNRGAWQLPAIHKLRDALNDNSTALEQLTTSGALDGDPVLGGATSAAKALVQSVHELLGGQSADGAEADAPQVLHRDLLALPAVRLDEDWSVVDPLPGTPALDITLLAEQSASSLAAGPFDALASATTARLQAEDFVGAGLIIEVLTASANERAEQLRTDHEIALATSRRQVTEIWQSTNDLLSHDRRAGYSTRERGGTAPRSSTTWSPRRAGIWASSDDGLSASPSRTGSRPRPGSAPALKKQPQSIARSARPTTGSSPGSKTATLPRPRSTSHACSTVSVCPNRRLSRRV